MVNSEEFKQYLSGFFDGDGSIAVEKFNGGYTIRIKFSQSNEKFVETIKRHYPFLHKTNTSQRRDNSRIEFELRAAGIQIKGLVRDLMNYSILKYEQLLEADKFFELIGVRNKTDEKEAIYLKLRELKKHSTLKPYERLNKIYIAGLLDAEGCIQVNGNSFSVGIVRKSDTVILEKIAEMYNNTNKISNYTINFHGRNCKQILNDILPFCIYKTPQIQAGLKYIETIGVEITNEIRMIREQCDEFLCDEKRVDFDKTDLRFKNQIHHKNYIIRCINEFKKMSYHDTIMYCKMKEIEEMKTFEKFDDKIFNLSYDEWSDFNIQPVLEFCETTNQHQMFNYYRKKTSSLPSNAVMGKSIRILVKDQLSNKYIGLMTLSSDIYNLGPRDNLLNWNKKNKDKQLNENLMNLTCCVPLQPFGFNTNGGKLIASLAFSKEIFDYHLEKYKTPLLAILTTSINGKSIQYDRLDCMKMIGYTKGYGSVNIPNELYKVCKEYNDIWKVIPKDRRPDKLSFFKSLIRHLKLPQKILLHNRQRGIYFGFLFSSKMENQYNINELNSVQTIYSKWKSRWCDKRIHNVIANDTIKTELNLYTLDSFKGIIKYQLPRNKKIFTDQLIKEVLSYKTQIYTQEQVCDLLNAKYNIDLVKNDISRIYMGTIAPKNRDREYLELVSMKANKRKLSDPEIYFIIDALEKDISYSDILIQFNKKFNKTITKGSISDIKNKKLEPYLDRPIETPVHVLKVMDPNDKFRLLNDEQLLQIIRMKSQKLTTQEVADFIKLNFNVTINRNFVSKLWNGEINFDEKITNLTDYQQMLSNTKQRTIKNRKFTDEEIEWVKTNHLDKSLLERSKLFQIKFDKTITKTYISNLT